MREVCLPGVSEQSEAEKQNVCAPFGVYSRFEDERVARHESFEPTRPSVSIDLGAPQ